MGQPSGLPSGSQKWEAGKRTTVLDFCLSQQSVGREHSCFEFSLPFSVCSILRLPQRRLAAQCCQVSVSLPYFRSRVRHSLGSPGVCVWGGCSWEAGEQASSQNSYVSKIHQLPVRHLYEDFFLKSYLSMESQEIKYSAHTDI